MADSLTQIFVREYQDIAKLCTVALEEIDQREQRGEPNYADRGKVLMCRDNALSMMLMLLRKPLPRRQPKEGQE